MELLTCIEIEIALAPTKKYRLRPALALAPQHWFVHYYNIFIQV